MLRKNLFDYSDNQIVKLYNKKENKQMKTIKVEIKNVYGTERIYPICENAKRFAMLTNTKTFNRAIIAIIKQIGAN
jgi:hypothetical protein